MVSSNCTCASYDTATTNIAHFTGSNLDYVSFLLPSHVRPSRTSRSEAFRMRTSSSKVRQFPCVKPLRTCSVTCIHNNPYKSVHHESPHRIARLSKCIYLKLQSARSTVLLAVSEEHAPRTASRVDAIVRATWPDPVTEPELHNIVQTFMTHKDCKKHHRVCYREGQSVCSRGFPNLLRALRLSTPEATRYTNGPNKTPTLFPTMPFFYFFSSPTSTSKCAPWPTSSPTYTRECFVKIHCNVMTFICLSVTIVSAHQHCFLLTKTSSITVNCILGTFTSHRIVRTSP